MNAIRRLSVLFATVCMLLSCSSPSPPEQEESEETIRLLTPANFKETLTQAEEDLVFVNFWATWCVPCMEEFPDLVKLEKEYGDKAIAFWAVSCDTEEDRKTKVPQFLEEQGSGLTSFAINLSEQEEMIETVSPDWQGTLPTTFILRRSGEILFQHSGKMSFEEFKAMVDQALEGKI